MHRLRDINYMVGANAGFSQMRGLSHPAQPCSGQVSRLDFFTVACNVATLPSHLSLTLASASAIIRCLRLSYCTSFFGFGFDFGFGFAFPPQENKNMTKVIAMDVGNQPPSNLPPSNTATSAKRPQVRAKIVCRRCHEKKVC